ncbi:MAG: DUF2183 domain-containing protein [Verrucomicrobiales bacterium]|nr:DUF2183 domain-containing protein [Verrucomicrobiales bacterium]
MWKKIAHLIEKEVDDIKYSFTRLSGISQSVEIKDYPGFANHSKAFVRARVLKKKELPGSTATDSDWRNFINTSRNWFTDEIPHAKVEVRVGDQVQLAEADDEGYIMAELDHELNPPALSDAITAHLRLVEPATDQPVVCSSPLQMPGPGAEFGVISDIDDTVFYTGATQLMTMVKNTLLGNVHTRIVFEGVSAYYGALLRGQDGRGKNPFFYVTSSPWNLFDMITQIFELRGIPHGSLFMKDWGVDEGKFLKSGHHTHKASAIEKVLKAYPELSFVLLGDSGQEDPEIYTSVLDKYSDRIRAIYIRDVSTNERDVRVIELAAKASEKGVDLLLSDSSIEFAEHSAKLGLISENELPAIKGQVKADRAAE